MPEELFVYEPDRIATEKAAVRAAELHIPQVVKGMTSWMELQNVAFGKDGTVIVVLSSVPRRNAAREVLATLHDEQQTRENLDAIEDFPADPAPEPVVTLKELTERVAVLEASLVKLAEQRR